MNTNSPGVRIATILATLLAGGILMASLDKASSQSPSESGAGAGGDPQLEQATFGNGCFWCTEAVFSELKGVTSAVSGYSGGHVENPDYKHVCTGLTGHAEVVQVTFDPQVISFAELLEVFFKTHDPTTLNRQGPDEGTQYRSAVFYHSEQQRKTAEQYKQQLDQSGAYDAPIVTEITKFDKFYPAEDYHQQYYELNGREPYCRVMIRPKVEKVRHVFKDKLKDAEERKQFERE
jgi:methionine-S-sulfoxide reductase